MAKMIINFVKMVRDIFKRLEAHSNKKVLERRMRDIDRCVFTFKVFDNSLFIMCGGTAIEEMPLSATLKDITARIEQYKITAKNYERNEVRRIEENGL